MGLAGGGWRLQLKIRLPGLTRQKQHNPILCEVEKLFSVWSVFPLNMVQDCLMNLRQNGQKW